MARRLQVDIFRYNPCDPESKPRTDRFFIEEKDNMNIFLLLTEIRETQDPSLKFDFVCRSAVCGSCGMLINGRPRLACKTKTKELSNRITLYPLPGFKIIGDLSVDTGSWFREMEVYIRSWIHTTQSFHPEDKERRIDNELVNRIFEYNRCIECGCCRAACATAKIKEDFLGAAAINFVGRFLIDPRDDRDCADFFDVIGTDDGVFGCAGLMACEDVCPRGLRLQDTISFIRRTMAFSQLGSRFKPAFRLFKKILRG